MFLISTVTFLLSTAAGAAQISPIVITIYSAFVAHQDVPLMDRLLLANGQLNQIDIVLEWTTGLLVRFSILNYLNHLALHS